MHPPGGLYSTGDLCTTPPPLYEEKYGYQERNPIYLYSTPLPLYEEKDGRKETNIPPLLTAPPSSGVPFV